MSREAGKGSSPRPFSVSKDKFSENWDRIFKKDKEKSSEKSQRQEKNK